MPLPRFRYAAATTSSSLKGFLITCTLDREKSATKEAITILSDYLRIPPNVQCGPIVEGALSLEDGGCGLEIPVQEGKFSKEEPQCCSSGHGGITEDGGGTEGSETAEYTIFRDMPTISGEVIGPHSPVLTVKSSLAEEQPLRKNGSAKRKREDSDANNLSGLFVLKMSQKGVISLFLHEDMEDDPVNVLNTILKDIQDGARKPPLWCQRLVPVQETCRLLKDDLSLVVIKLIKQHVRGFVATETDPLKFAVAYDRRGVESTTSGILGKMDCINLVAVSIKETIPHSLVDLLNPQMVVMVELIPLAGGGIQGSPMCGVAVLSGEMVNAKPKLCVKPLVPSSHPSKKSRQQKSQYMQTKPQLINKVVSRHEET